MASVKSSGTRDDNGIKSLGRDGTAAPVVRKLSGTRLRQRSRARRSRRSVSRQSLVTEQQGETNAAVESTDCQVGGVSCAAFYAVLGTVMLCAVLAVFGLWKVAKGTKGKSTETKVIV